MKMLDRYVTREMLVPFLFGICVFTSLFVSSDLLRLASLVVEVGAPVEAVVKVFFLQMPQVIVYTLPMSVLLATLLALSRLSSTNEIISMRASGLHFARIVAPVWVVAALVSVAAFLLNEVVVPVTNYEAERVMAEEVRGRSLPTRQEHVVIRGQEGSAVNWILYARTFDGTAQTMGDIVLTRLENHRPVETTSARRAVWVDEAWYMEDTVSHLYLGDGRVVTLSYPEGRQPMQIRQTPSEIAARNKDPDQMSLTELREHVAVLREQGVDVKKLEVQLYQKYALPLASLIFALVAAPLGMQPARSASSIGFGISIVIIFIYYVLMSLGTALGQSGTLPPVIGGWLQNIVIGGTGVFLIIRQGG